MIVVGLDIGREFHSYHVLDEERFVSRGKIANTVVSFESWAPTIENLGRDICVVVENGNGLAAPFQNFAKTRGWRTGAVSAAAVRHYREHVLGKNSKTDALDAETIAILGRQTPNLRECSRPKGPLQRISRERFSLVKQKVRVVNQLRASLAELWPEFTTKAVRVLAMPTFCCLIENCPDPLQIAKLGYDGTRELLKAAGAKPNRKFLQRIVDLAIEHRTASPDDERKALILEARLLGGRLNHLLTDIARCEELLSHLAETDEMVQIIDSIPGAGTVLASAIAAEIQNIRNYRTESHLASYAGLALKQSQTGKTRNCWIPQIRSNRLLKQAVLLLAMHNSMRSEISQNYVARKLKEGKKPLQARRALARQLIRKIFALLSTSSKYTPTTTRHNSAEGQKLGPSL